VRTFFEWWELLNESFAMLAVVEDVSGGAYRDFKEGREWSV
jgi:hypothetical protein